MSLNQWTEVRISPTKHLTIITDGGRWNVSTKNSAGGYAYLFPNPTTIGASGVRVSWRWQVRKFPRMTSILPFHKTNDDYALRIGILVANGSGNIRVPPSIQGLLNARQSKLSYVLFYCAKPLTQEGDSCGKNPYNDRILNCLRPATDQSMDISVAPLEDLARTFQLSYEQAQKLQIIGVWIFADSDNTRSESDADLESIRVFWNR